MEGSRLFVEESCMPHIKILPHNLPIEVCFFKTLTGSSISFSQTAKGCFHIGSQRKRHQYLSFMLRCVTGSNVPVCVHTGFLKIVCVLQCWKDAQAPNDELVLLLYPSNSLQKGLGLSVPAWFPSDVEDSSHGLETNHHDSSNFPQPYWFQKNNYGYFWCLLLYYIYYTMFGTLFVSQK